ncbi:hypothetical protein AGLY_007009 [Aphis glycines]|uniref:Uncharacterized protein n=1 Tax=Aphis glycines TaxID=307491 RepID=A0A6G0TPD9_APHGL|nr:hypothetical protein AGLY_007009 [Aphis glycines]
MNHIKIFVFYFSILLLTLVTKHKCNKQIKTFCDEKPTIRQSSISRSLIYFIMSCIACETGIRFTAASRRSCSVICRCCCRLEIIMSMTAVSDRPIFDGCGHTYKQKYKSNSVLVIALKSCELCLSIKKCYHQFTKMASLSLYKYFCHGAIKAATEIHYPASSVFHFILSQLNIFSTLEQF